MQKTASELRKEIIARGVVSELGGQPDGTIMQNPTELSEFSLWLLNQGVKKYLEIGTARGGTLAFMIEVLQLDGWGVDPVIPTKVSPDRVFCNHSLNVLTRRWVKSKSPWDLIFIDGDHKYEIIKREYINYWPLTRVMAFHDIAGRTAGEEPKRAWQEVKEKNPTNNIEFISEDPAYHVGIGVIWK